MTRIFTKHPLDPRDDAEVALCDKFLASLHETLNECFLELTVKFDDPEVAKKYDE